MLAHALSLLAPPLCGACGGAAAPGLALCPRCDLALRLARPLPVLIPGADQAIAATAYEGISRQLVAALKFRGRLSVARPMAAAIAAAVNLPPDAALVAVPPARSRQWRRGFDPADEIAAALSRLTGRPVLSCLRRAESPRQVGRARRDRLASPPRVWASGPVPPTSLLVDDVVTTGATLASCALALRTAGATEVRAAAFARSVGPGGPGSSPLAALGAARDRA